MIISLLIFKMQTVKLLLCILYFQKRSAKSVLNCHNETNGENKFKFCPFVNNFTLQWSIIAFKFYF